MIHPLILSKVRWMLQAEVDFREVRYLRKQALGPSEPLVNVIN